MKKFIILFLLMFSLVLADTEDWEDAVTLVSNQPAHSDIFYHIVNWTVSAHVDIDGIHVFYDDGTTQPGGGYWKIATFDIDGTSLYSHNVTSDWVMEAQIDGNDDAIFIVWVDTYLDSGYYYGRIRAKISRNGGETWSNTYSKKLDQFTSSPFSGKMRDLSIDVDDDGIHCLSVCAYENGGVEYCFLPNDADSDNDWVWTGGAPDDDHWVHPSDSDDNGWAVEAINDYGTSSYDNICIAYNYWKSSNNYTLGGAISVDNGDNWDELDDFDSDNGLKLYGMDMAFDGDDDFICVWTEDNGSIDSLFYSSRKAKGISSYSENWSSINFIENNIHINSYFDVCSRDDGYVDLVYGIMGGTFKYRKISTSSSGTAETILNSSGFHPDVTNHNDIFVVYRTTHKLNDGDIKFKYRDTTPIAPSIVRSWSGSNPKITWAKPCLDTKEYQVWRKLDSGSYILRATTSNFYFVENQYWYYRRGSHSLRYKIKAVDHDNNLSTYSNEVYYSHMKEAFKIIGEFRPTEYVLYNACPNPFNPTTTITFDIPKSGYVSLSLYNSIGQKILDLVKGNVEVGQHQVQVDGSNLSSGIYFIKMITNTFSKMQKIVLMK